MRIPEKYRERYDRLAMNHPWMREMRDEHPPEGDAVDIMRKAASGFSGGTGIVTDNLKVLLKMDPSATSTSVAVNTLADMVERDYVSREKYDSLQSRFIAMTALPDKQVIESLEKQRDEWKERYDSVLEGRNHWSGIADGIYRRFYPREEYCMPNDPTDMINKAIDAIEAERDELKAKVDDIMDEPDYREAWERMHKERDEWKTKCDISEVAYKQADAERKRYSEQIDELRAERDEWKAKAEAKSAKRAAAAERVRKAKDAGTSIGYAIVGRAYYPWEAYETLIDLLTDEPMDAYRDANGTCPDGDETCPNDGLPPEIDVSAEGVDANDANATCNNSGENVTHDSREQYMALFDEAHRLECENKNLAIDLSECMEAKGALEDELRAVKRQLKQEQGMHSVTLNNWEQAKGKLRRERESLQAWKAKLDERDARAVEDIAAEQVAQYREKAEYWKGRAEESWERLSAVKEAVAGVVDDMRALV